MLSEDLAVYTKTKTQVHAILVRRRQLFLWEKIVEDEQNIDYSVVTYWRDHLAALYGRS